MKKLLLFLCALLASGGLSAQIVLLNENMDSYATNSFLGNDNPTWFTTWSNLPGSGEDAQILTTYAHSGTKSASADLTGGQTDCLLKLGNKTTGNYEVKWWMYVETTKCGYYNIQHSETPGIEWAFEIYFRTSGTTELTRGGVTVTGTYPKATWFEVKQIVKLDADSIYLYINGSLLSAWPFHWTNSATTGTKQLGAVDLFAGEFSGSGETPGFFFDDVMVSQLGTQAPTVVTAAATAVTTSTATVNGTVNANIQSTTVTFEYGLTTAYGSSIAGVPPTVTGTTVTPVSANLTGLLPGATYHYRAKGVNSVGTTNGADMTFTTAPILPAVVTTAATSVNSTGATLNGTVDAGGASTAVSFEYGLTVAYGTTVPGVPATVTGNGATAVSAAITGLTLNTTYHYRVKGVNSVGPADGLDMTFVTTACPMPAQAGAITGPTTACGNSLGNVYTVPPITNATGYTWTVPPGSTITAGANTNTITVTLGNTSGNVTVLGTNTCGSGGLSTLAVTLSPAPVPTITGQTSMCAGSGYYTYSTQAGFNNYTWTVSSGGTIAFGAGTNTIQVLWNTAGAQSVSVNYTNSTGCAAGTATVLPVTVNSVPAAAGAITGAATVCSGATGVVYSVGAVANALSYAWTLPAGATVVSGQYTNSITVNFAANASSGAITVSGNNLCGNGSPSPGFAVTVNPLPGPAGTITGPATVCKGDAGVVYTVPAVANATGYTWTLPAGATIVSGGNTNSVTVSFSLTASSGNITVLGSNSCGAGTVSPNFAVTANPVPAAPVITASGYVLTSSAATGNQWFHDGTAVSGATAQTYTVPSTAPGYYWSEVTLLGCTSDESNHVYIAGVGIGENTAGTFNIFPVPSNGLFTVSITSPAETSFNISVYNELGVTIKQVKDVVVNGTVERAIDIRPAPAGVYTVVFTNSENKVIRKILVNR